MKNSVVYRNLFKRLVLALWILPVSCLVFSCATLDPQKVDVELPVTDPFQKITQFYSVLDDMGLMTEIYDIEELRVQSMDIDDKTGTAGSTQGEIPQRITEMVKSTLNSIGGLVTYIPYDPYFIQSQNQTGYAINNITRPEVILSGGITEFDRGLETRGGNTDLAGQKKIAMIPEFIQGSNVGMQYGGNAKAGLARITLDFNLLDFNKMIGIPKMNTTNSMEVGKALKGKELAVSVFGLSFGRKGTIKKVQGRHEAVRLLVELSMIQIVGRHKALPYWRLLGDDALEDRIVIRKLDRFYHRLTGSDRIQFAQEYLYLHGYDLIANGEMDSTTVSALQQFSSDTGVVASEIDLDTFKRLYLTIPITEETKARRDTIKSYYAMIRQQEAEQLALQQQQIQQQQEALSGGGSVETVNQEQVPVLANVTPAVTQVEEVSVVPRKKPSLGRILAEEEW
jgi:hypothetical protein